MTVFSCKTCPSIAFNPSSLRIADDKFHELPAETAAFEVGADDNGVFAALVIGIRMQADDAQELAARLPRSPRNAIARP